jgi:site-specific DNA-cytosine methylase
MTVPPAKTVLELFCGIGGCAAALGSQAQVVAAVDIHQPALSVYRANFSHPTFPLTIESITNKQLHDWNADLWWMSPPCQPYTARGLQRDDQDPRAAALMAVIERIADVRPKYVALENVPPFADSQSLARLRHVLEACGYDIRTQLLCATQLGIPNRRLRFYLTASRVGWPTEQPRPKFHAVSLKSLLDTEPELGLEVESDIVERYDGALNVVDPADPNAVTACFTRAYGSSPVRSGSYLWTRSGLRRFSPREVLRLLGFPETFRLPEGVSREAAWRLAGNSVSVPAIRTVLAPTLGSPSGFLVE